jgi:hypothetical protein
VTEPDWDSRDLGGDLNDLKSLNDLNNLNEHKVLNPTRPSPRAPLRQLYNHLEEPLFLNGGTLEIASVSTEVNSIVPYLCAVYSRVNVPGKIPVLIHKYAIEIFRCRHFLED